MTDEENARNEIDKLHRLLEEARAVVGAGVLHKQSPEKLDELLLACRRWSSSNPHDRSYESTIAALREEIDRRKLEARHTQETQRHTQLKTAVDGLKSPHQLHWWLLAVAILTMIFAGIAALDVILKWIQGR
jgi:hypothetical protein